MHKTLKQAVIEDLDNEGYRHNDEQLLALQVDKVPYCLSVLLLHNYA